MSEARAYTPTVTRVKTVRVIPPTIQPLSDIPAFSARPRRVAAYARVSTSSEEQLTSYEAQVGRNQSVKLPSCFINVCLRLEGLVRPLKRRLFS